MFVVLVSTDDGARRSSRRTASSQHAPAERTCPRASGSSRSTRPAPARAPRDAQRALLYRATGLPSSRRRATSSTSRSSTRLGHEGISYTADWDEAVAAVDARRRRGRRPAAPAARRGRARRRRRGERDAAEDDLLLSRSSSRGLLFHPVVTDWLAACRAAVEDVRGCSPSCRPASSASPSCARARAATTRPRSTRPRRRAILDAARGPSTGTASRSSPRRSATCVNGGGTSASSSTRSTAR